MGQANDVASTTLTGLTNGTTYYLRINSLVQDGLTFRASDWSPIITVTPNTTSSPPGKPDAPTVTGGDRSLAVAWTAPADDGGNTITAYDLRHRTNPEQGTPGAWTEVEDVWVTGGGALAYTITGLINGTRYDVEVRAVSGGGTGAWSDPTQGTPVAPSMSIAADAAAITEGEKADFTITASVAPAEDMVVGLTVAATGDYGVTAGSQTVTINKGATTGALSLATVDDLLVEADGAVTVTVNTGTGYSVAAAPANSASVTVSDNDDLSDFPTDLAATPGNGQVSLSWNEPDDTGTSDISGYTVEYSTAADFSASPQTESTPACPDNPEPDADPCPATGLTVTGLTNGTEYHFRVWAASDAGAGAKSGSVAATPRTIPGVPTMFSVTPSHKWITVSWSPPTDDGGADIAYYTLQYIDDPTFATAWTIDTASGAVRTLNVSAELVPNTEFYFHLRAVNAAGVGPWTADLSGALLNPTVTITADATEVTEGSDATFTVTASPAPLANIQVDVAVSAEGDFGVSDATMSVTIESNTGSSTLTVPTTVDLLDEDDGKVTASLGTGTGYIVGTPASAEMDVRDDDKAPGAPTGLTADGDDGQVSLEWVAPDDPGTSVIDRYMVEYSTAADFSASPQTVSTPECTVPDDEKPVDEDNPDDGKAASDEDDKDDPCPKTELVVSGLTNIETYYFRVRAESAAGVGPYSDSASAVPRNTPTITISGGSAIVEGQEATFTLTADPAPTNVTSVTVEVAAAPRFGIASAVTESVDLASGETSTTFTVATAGDDVDEPDGTITATVQAPGTGGAVGAAAPPEYEVGAANSAMVTVRDNDTAGITVTADSLTVTEGGSATYTVKLNTEPSEDVVISLTVTGSSDVTVADTDGDTDGVQNTLTFTSTDWSTLQTVTVNAAEDDDAVNDAATIAHMVVDDESADEYDPVANVDLAVTVTDGDTAGITIIAADPFTVAEGGSATYTVKLDSEPSSDVVIEISSNNVEVTIADTDTVMTGVQNTLTFKSTDWDTPQTVTVNAAEDDDAVNDAATITHAVVDASSADEYDPVANVDLSVTVTDDSAGITIIAADPFTVGEGSSATYTVKLDSEPSGDVVLALTSNNAEVTIADTDKVMTGVQNTLTFTSTDWDTPQTVTVNAGEDDDAVNDAATIAHRPRRGGRFQRRRVRPGGQRGPGRHRHRRRHPCLHQAITVTAANDAAVIPSPWVARDLSQRHLHRSPWGREQAHGERQFRGDHRRPSPEPPSTGSTWCWSNLTALTSNNAEVTIATTPTGRRPGCRTPSPSQRGATRLEHGADRDRQRRPGRRRGERRGRHRPRRGGRIQRRRVRPGGERGPGRDGHRRRHGGDHRVGDPTHRHRGGGRGPHRHLHREAQHPAHRGSDDYPVQQRGERGHGVRGSDLHHGQLEHRTDGDGDRGG